MKADFPLKADRVAAVHCEALLAHRLTDEDRLAKLGGVVEDIARAMAERLARTMGIACRATVEPATLMGSSALQQAINRPGAALRLLALGEIGERLHLVIFAQGLDAAVERVLGGGQSEAARAPDPAPRCEAAPLRHSAVLLRQRVEQAFDAALAELLADTPVAPQAAVRQSTANLVLAVRQKMASCMVTIEDLGAEPLRLQLALREEAIGALISAWRMRTRGTRRPADCGADPWGAIALPVHAVLADTDIPLSRIGALRPGDVLTLPLRRQVPLMCQDRALAWGSVGEVDDCTALRITSLDRKGNGS